MRKAERHRSTRPGTCARISQARLCLRSRAWYGCPGYVCRAHASQLTACFSHLGTRPSTIGHVLSSSPLALLAWYVPVPVSVSVHVPMYPPTPPNSPLTNLPISQDRREIHRMVRRNSLSRRDSHQRFALLLHRLFPAQHLPGKLSTDSHPCFLILTRHTSTPLLPGPLPLYPPHFLTLTRPPPQYRASVRGSPLSFPPSTKPTGFSFFPKELFPGAKYLLEEETNLVSYSAHERGGHFAALEKPEELWADVEAFVAKVMDGGSKL